jgi:hypothetical protein
MVSDKEVLEEFERNLLSAIAQADKYGVPQADVMRPYLRQIPEPTLRYRIGRMERQNKIRTRDVGGRKLLLPVEE